MTFSVLLSQVATCYYMSNHSSGRGNPIKCLAQVHNKWTCWLVINTVPLMLNVKNWDKAVNTNFYRLLVSFYKEIESRSTNCKIDTLNIRPHCQQPILSQKPIEVTPSSDTVWRSIHQVCLLCLNRKPLSWSVRQLTNIWQLDSKSAETFFLCPWWGNLAYKWLYYTICMIMLLTYFWKVWTQIVWMLFILLYLIPYHSKYFTGKEKNAVRNIHSCTFHFKIMVMLELRLAVRVWGTGNRIGINLLRKRLFYQKIKSGFFHMNPVVACQNYLLLYLTPTLISQLGPKFCQFQYVPKNFLHCEFQLCKFS